MAFKFDRSRPLAQEVQRVSREQFDYALACLEQTNGPNAPEAVHEFRKTTKKLRAFLRLLANVLPSADRTRWESTLRDAALDMAQIRDAVVLLQLVEQAYGSILPSLPPQVRSQMAEALLSQLPRASRDANAACSPVAQSVALSTTSDEVQRALGDTLELAELLPTLIVSYRSGRKALKNWRDKRSIEHLHRLRKRTKAHLYQVRLMTGLSSKSVRRSALALEQLAELLGTCHDLAQLRDLILVARGQWSACAEPAGMMDWVQRRLARSERRAMRLAVKLYRASPKHRRRQLRRALNTH